MSAQETTSLQGKVLELHPTVRAEVEERFSAVEAGIVIAELERLPGREISKSPEDAWRAYGRARVQLAIVRVGLLLFAILAMSVLVHLAGTRCTVV